MDHAHHALEYIVIAEIIKHCLQNGLGCEGGVISPFYSAVVEFVKTLNTTLPLGHKTIEQVELIPLFESTTTT